MGDPDRGVPGGAGERRFGLTARDGLVILALSAAVAAASGYALLRGRFENRPSMDARDAAMKTDLNSSTWQQLTLLPGIGEKTARAIVADRESRGRYNSIDDLARVKGIGPAVMRRIGPHAECR